MAESDGHAGDSFTVKCTDANVSLPNWLGPFGVGISIQDLRGEDKQGTYKVIDTRKPFFNEFELLEQIKKLVKENPNDETLGSKVRKLLI